MRLCQAEDFRCDVLHGWLVRWWSFL
jgi:hypothetical protein